MAIDKEKIKGIAQRFIFRGQSSKAIKEHLKLIEASPRDKRLHLKLGDLYLKSGDNEKAIDEYLTVAALYAEEDLNSRSISIYKKVLSLDSKRIEAYHQMANLYVKDGLGGSAKTCYQNILKINPDDQEALKGLERLEEGPPKKEAEERLHFKGPAPKFVPRPEPRPEERKSPVTPSPSPEGGPMPPETERPLSDKDSETHYHLGIAYKEMDLLDYAVSEFELAMEDSSLTGDCHIMLAECLMEKGDYAQAVKHYKTAAESKGLPKDKMARIHYNLGSAYEASGMTPEALNSFRHALELDQALSEAEEKIKQLQVPSK